MEILRPPPGHRDDEAPPPPKNSLGRFLFAVLFLLIGMVVFFIRGLVVRNPGLPTYLLDRMVRGFRGDATRSATTGRGVSARPRTSSRRLRRRPPNSI